jgi:hypothetical protein
MSLSVLQSYVVSACDKGERERQGTPSIYCQYDVTKHAVKGWGTALQPW